MVIYLERGADLHTVQIMPLPLTVSSFSKMQIGFTFLIPAHLGSLGKKAVKRVCIYYIGTKPFLLAKSIRFHLSTCCTHILDHVCSVVRNHN